MQWNGLNWCQWGWWQNSGWQSEDWQQQEYEPPSTWHLEEEDFVPDLLFSRSGLAWGVLLIHGVTSSIER